MKKGKATATTAPVEKTKKAAVKSPAVEDTPGYVPQEPTAKGKKESVLTKDASGKPMSASDIEVIKLIKACGAEWRSDKAKGTLPAGENWPQFWSACNTRLKNQG